MKTKRKTWKQYCWAIVGPAGPEPCSFAWNEGAAWVLFLSTDSRSRGRKFWQEKGLKAIQVDITESEVKK